MATTTIDPVRPVHLTAGEISFYQREGWLVVPQLLSAEVAAALRDDVVSIMEQIGGWESAKLRQTPEYLPDSPVDHHVHSRNLAALAETLLGGPAVIWLPFTAVKGPQGGRFHFHQDNNYTRLEGPGLNIWVALVDMGPELGTLQVVPQSHRSGTRPADQLDDGHRAMRIEESDFIPMRLRAGDAVVFSRDTIHGSGPNTGPGPRVAYAVQYGREDARYPHPETGEPTSVRDDPKYGHTHRPVATLTAPTARIDGH
ncbi:phytanoyl-CoA dioxygenase family protein [Microlunatus sp. Y2014]|uniref:phytanoyl-CoA dioxygenase family protein n=1 Tax=Microlunatus sp. Y2014 TaxID=3418488 RepID=UPI003DA78B21